MQEGLDFLGLPRPLQQQAHNASLRMEEDGDVVQVESEAVPVEGREGKKTQKQCLENE